MSAVFVVGAETLSVPPTAIAPADAVYCRYVAVCILLAYELSILHNTGYMTAIGCASDSSLVQFFQPTSMNSVVPPGLTADISFATASAMSFSPDMIININGGLQVDTNLQSQIATLLANAENAGVLWREVNEIITPQIEILPTRPTNYPPTAIFRVPGVVHGYLGQPTTIRYSLNAGSTWTSLTIAVDYSFNVSVPGTTGTHNLLVQDSAHTQISASASYTFG